MYINVSGLKNELVVLEDIIKKYEDNVINIYYILEKSFEYWKDNYSSYYYEDLCVKKNNLLDILDDIKFIESIYKYIERSYSKFGNVIDIDFDKNNELIELFNNYLLDINKLSYDYNNLNLTFISTEYYDIVSQKENVIKSKDKLNDIKNDYINFFDAIKKIENNILFKVSNYFISPIKIDDNDYIYQIQEKRNDSSIYIGGEDLRRVVESVSMYVKEQKLLISKVRDISNSIKNHYVTNNGKKLNSLWLQLIFNMDSFVRYFINYIDVLNYVISLKEVLIEKYDNAFKSIGKFDLIVNNNMLDKGDNYDK